MVAEVRLDPVALARLRTLQDGDEPHLVAEMAALFLSEGPKRLAALFDTADLERARLAAHSLRGSAALLGATDLARACQELEQATAMDLGRLEAVRAEYERVRPLIVDLSRP